MLVPLPEFVLTSEEFQSIKEPPIVNLIYQEVKSNQKQFAFNTLDDPTKAKRKRSRWCIALGFFVMIAIALIVTLSVLLSS